MQLSSGETVLAKARSNQGRDAPIEVVMKEREEPPSLRDRVMDQIMIEPIERKLNQIIAEDDAITDEHWERFQREDEAYRKQREQYRNKQMAKFNREIRAIVDDMYGKGIK